MRWSIASQAGNWIRTPLQPSFFSGLLITNRHEGTKATKIHFVLEFFVFFVFFVSSWQLLFRI